MRRRWACGRSETMSQWRPADYYMLVHMSVIAIAYGVTGFPRDFPLDSAYNAWSFAAKFH